jgi:hypothetical protein
MTVANPQSFNRYTYVLNSPTNLTDPSGMVNSHGDSRYPWEEDPFGDIPWTTGEGYATVEGYALTGVAASSDSGTLTGTVVDPPEEIGFGQVLYMDRTTAEHYCDFYSEPGHHLIYSEMNGVVSDVTTAIVGYSDQPTAEPLGRQQPKYGLYPGDDRGHIVGAALGGSPQSENLFSQDPRVNRGAYRDFEADIRRVLTKHHDWVALIKVTLVYEQGASCSKPTNPERYFRPIGEQYSVAYMERYTNRAKAMGTPASKWFSN